MNVQNVRQLAPWTIRPLDNSPLTTRPLDNSPQTTRPRSSDNAPPIYKHLCYVGKIYFYAHKLIISWRKKKVCFLKYITRPRLTFVAFDCNDRVNTGTWPFRNPATTFEVIEVRSNCLCFMFWSIPLWKSKHQTQITNNFDCRSKQSRHIECAIFEHREYQPRPVG